MWLAAKGGVDVEAAAFAFLDLRFADGHVERWLGPGRSATMDARPTAVENLQSWAVETADEFAFHIACDFARGYAISRPPAVDNLPCEEVVIEWRAQLPTFD